jgi:putative transposase
MKINRALKVRIYPTIEQQVFINKTLGSCRLIYNQMLAERISIYDQLKDNKEKLYTYKYKTEKQYKEEFEFLKEVDSKALQFATRNLIAAYANFYRSLKKINRSQKVGFPKFKSKKNHYDSYTTCMAIKIDFDKKTIKLPKLSPVKFKHRKNTKSWYRFAELKKITVSREPTGKYFASLLFEGEQDFKGEQDITNPKIIGLDMSLQDFYIDNLGNSPSYKKNYREHQGKLAKAQKQLSRKTKGSKNREKARIKVARIHEQIRNKKKDFLEQLSLKLIKENDVIVVENLSLKGMSQALKLGKSIMDLGYSSFISKLQYKALWNDKSVILADKWFASSKTCSVCGYIKKDLMLQERSWECPKCRTTHHRDINAAINLQKLGKKIIGLEEPKLTPVEIEALVCSNTNETIVSETGNLSSDAKKPRSL